MFSSKTVGRLLSACIVAIIIVMLFSAAKSDAASAKPGRTCSPVSGACVELTLLSTGKPLISGSQVKFRVRFGNNLELPLQDVAIRYFLPRQLIVRGISPTTTSSGFDGNLLEWKIDEMLPGESLTAIVKAEILAYAPIRVRNVVEITAGDWKLVKAGIGYDINMSAAVASG